MGYFIMGMQLLMSLSILVTLHELGHLLPAKWFGMRVEKFYLFFNPRFELFKRQIGETEYGIGWVPLGGYVKIAGMMDESLDKEALKQPPQEWEFRSKPAWQRLIVMIGGVTINFILGIFLLAMLAWQYGDQYLPTEELDYGISTSTLAQEMGLKDGDLILAIGDRELTEFNPGLVSAAMLLDQEHRIKIQRAGEAIIFDVPDSSVLKIPRYQRKEGMLYSVRIPFVIGKVDDESPAAEAGLQEGDSIVALNGAPMHYFMEFKRAMKPFKDSTVTVSYYRDGVLATKEVGTTENAVIGARPFGPDRYFDFKRKRYSLAESFPLALTRSVQFMRDQIKGFGQMFTGRLKASENLGGMVSIGKMFPPYWDWEHFWRMTAILSLVLGFMNLLPIPALDGGHVVFLLYEMIARRPVSDRVLEVAQVVGLILVLGLILFANGNDIYQALAN